MDKLTVDQVIKIADNDFSIFSDMGLVDGLNILAKKLLETMRENDRMRGIIETCECGASDAMEDHSNKQSENVMSAIVSAGEYAPRLPGISCNDPVFSTQNPDHVGDTNDMIAVSRDTRCFMVPEVSYCEECARKRRAMG